MCQCDPRIRTPFCGRGDCQWPKQQGVKTESAVWTYDVRAPGTGILIRTPSGRAWGRVSKLKMAKQIVGTFNFANQMQDAVEASDILKAKSVLLRFGKAN